MVDRCSLAIAVLATVAPACGPRVDDADPDVALPTCGEDGPVRILPDLVAADVVEVGERWIVGGYRPPPNIREIDDLHAHLEIWAVGPCGEDPFELPNDLRFEMAGDLLLACDADGGADRLDPHGVRTTSRLFERVSCRFARTPAGLFAHDPIGQEILLHPSPAEDGAQVFSVAGSISVPGIDDAGPDPQSNAFDLSPPYAFEVLGEHVLALDTSSRLLRIDPDASSMVIAHDVAAFHVPTRGNRILIERRDTSIGSAESSVLESIDPVTGDAFAVSIETMFALDWPLVFGRAPGDTTPSERVAIDMRDGTTLPLPASSSYGFWLPREGTRVLFSVGGGLYLRNETYYSWSDDRYDWVELGTFPGCSVASESNERFEIYASDCESDVGEIWVVDFDGGPPMLGASGVTSNWRSTIDRVVWSHPTGGDGLAEFFGDLMVADLGDDRTWRLDRRGMLPFRVPENTHDDALYTVLDGDRTGLWRAALP